MALDERIFLCRLLEKMEGQEAYCESIGVVDRSSFQGKLVFVLENDDTTGK